MSSIEIMYADHVSFIDDDGERIYLVKLQSNKKYITVFKVKKGACDAIARNWEQIFFRIRVTKLTKETLQDIGIWEQLSQETQIAVNAAKEEVEALTKEKMAHARGKRQKKYPGWPEEVKCKCGHVQKINKTQLAKKMDKDQSLTIERYVKEYECRDCKRERKAS